MRRLFFHDLSKMSTLQGKVLRLILLINGLVLLLTCMMFFLYEYLSYRKSRIREVTAISRIISFNSTAALTFHDTEAANEMLSALRAESRIKAACLFGTDGKLFARYPAELDTTFFPKTPQDEGFTFTTNRLEYFASITLENRPLGVLFIRYNLEGLYNRLKVYAGVAVTILLMSSLLAYLLYKSLRNQISKPILALAETAHAIADHRDYSVRATKVSEDEIGLFTDAFNQMLDEIQQQTTALGKSQEEIRAFNQKLEQMVIDRTTELENVNRELESFSYSVSHDLRAPLRSIHGYVNILHEEYGPQLDAEAQRLIGIIQRNGQRMGQLIDDLLAFSKLGRRELTKTTVSIQEMVTNVIDEWRRLNPEDTVEFMVHPLPSAWGDYSTLRQVWINLISNAVKYSRKKEKPVVTIGAQIQDGLTTYYVQDNGAGFDMQYYDKLFGVFQRLHSTKDFEGTGVGLAIVQRIVYKHGGKVWAEARIDEGATFYFTLGPTTS